MSEGKAPYTATEAMLQEQENRRLKEIGENLQAFHEAIQFIKAKGYGQVTAIIRDGKITRIVKTEETKL